VGRSATDAGRHVRPQPLRFAFPVARFEPLAALLLAVGVTVAIATDGILPAYGTKALLALALPLNVITALWLTRPRVQ
jgi:hypothetical protein